MMCFWEEFLVIWFASGNVHKKKELGDILSAGSNSRAAAWDLRIPSEAGIAFGPEENGNTFLENALIKAAELYRLLGEKGVLRPHEAIIADDSGICVDALGGRPGIHSAYYGICGGSRGAAPDAARQNALLLDELGDAPQRSGRFVCAMVLYYSPERFFVAQE
ncbi:MAG: non-canonical purine NTP pyrophosphatase, partial [Treponema sp.]|nr:non-canonical purine NTP pyrophosphatase [Treponema sp.]